MDTKDLAFEENAISENDCLPNVMDWEDIGDREPTNEELERLDIPPGIHGDKPTILTTIILLVTAPFFWIKEKFSR